MRLAIFIFVVVLVATASFYLGTKYTELRSLDEDERMAAKRKLKADMKAQFDRLKQVEKSIAERVSAINKESRPDKAEEMQNEVDQLREERSNIHQYLWDAYGFDQKEALDRIRDFRNSLKNKTTDDDLILMTGSPGIDKTV